MSDYILVDDDANDVIDRSLDVLAFCLTNDLDADEVNALLALPRGGKRGYGGGAAPHYTIIRTR